MEHQKDIDIKQCTKCQLFKTINNFAYINKSKNKINPKCKSCINDYQQIWIQSESGRKSVNKCRLKSKYNLSIEEYNEMLEEQNYHCKICPSDLNLVIDHDHKTGQVRGVLCDTCNRTLGLFKDDVEILLRAINYLKDKI